MLHKDNLLLKLGLPNCIPRACVLTKICGSFAYNASAETDLTIEIQKTNVCDMGSMAIQEQITISGLSDAFTLNCFCEETSVLFDDCDIWIPTTTAGAAGGWTFPALRIVFYFELR